MDDEDLEPEPAADSGDDNSVDDRPEGSSDEYVSYELHEWAVEDRVMVESLLRPHDIARAWEGATLVVRVADREVVEEVLDEVVVSTTPVLDPAADKVAFEIGSWAISAQDTVIEAFHGAGIEYEIDRAGDLIVVEADEERAEDVFDSLDLDDPEGEHAESAQDVLSDLFLAVDRLAGNGRDAVARLDLVGAADRALDLPLPFGFDPAHWKDLVGRAEDLAERFRSGDPDDEMIAEDTQTLRNIIRPLV
ncbi:MAG: hypothetical protein GY929_06835 [Actinomycetia bacterium]|nr:hypothetical protein [Actinomycetes bacterium]